MRIRPAHRVPALFAAVMLFSIPAGAQTWKHRHKPLPQPPPAQEPASDPGGAPVFLAAEVMPSFPGGELALAAWLADSLLYPEAARRLGISGGVHVTFVVERDGAITGAEVLRGIGGGCDEEALRLVAAMPAWEPGMEKGERVRVRQVLPIRFTLPEAAGTPLDGEEEDPRDAVVIKDAPPSFPGGDEALERYVKSNVRYPVEAWRARIRGVVYTAFTVEADGRITEVRVLRGIGGGCDEEAVRLVSRMPPWTPALRDGQPVRAPGSVPVPFERKGL